MTYPTNADFIVPDAIRDDFSDAMSRMYRTEVGAYGDLLRIVSEVNAGVLASDDADLLNLTPEEDIDRISLERHAAIRVGTAQELAMIARIFAVMGMHPVGYYDLSAAGVPVHSTAFRPKNRKALARNPFRIFTSLLRLELIEDADLRRTAAEILARRRIFTPDAIALTERAEVQGGLTGEEAVRFVAAILETFRWHERACVDLGTFRALNEAHRLIADVVSFKGPHINHLTPRTLDIDAAQAAMQAAGLPAKAVIEGPPRRRCPILLRQTSFKAMQEQVTFPGADGAARIGHHTARFGEIEQRGVALTPKGRALYDRLLGTVRSPCPSGETATYEERLATAFAAFPDNWRTLHAEGLAYFKFSLARAPDAPIPADRFDATALVDTGVLALSPVIYEDFLPVSAAGIFQSNLGDEPSVIYDAGPGCAAFEAALGMPLADEFTLYAGIESASIARCRARLASGQAAA